MANTNYIKNLIKNNSNWKKVLENKGIDIKEDGDYTILKYNLLKADFNDPMVKECRGLIIHNREVVCRAFDKFGNYGEYYADDIDWTSAKVQEKMDGSIMKLWYNHYENRWFVSTNNSLEAKEVSNSSGENFGVMFSVALVDALKGKAVEDFLRSLNQNFTYIFELVSPNNRIVVPYDKTEIYHIGTRDMINGFEVNANIGIKKPKEYALNSLNDCIEVAKTFSANEHEGFVVVDKNWNRIKVKSPEYIVAHHLANNSVFNKKKGLDLVLEGEEEEFLNYFPEHKAAIDEIVNTMEQEKNKVKEIVDAGMAVRDLVSRKEYAITNHEFPWFGTAVAAIYDNKPIEFKPSYWKKFFGV